MTGKEKVSEMLLEMFPNLTKRQAMNLANSGDDINILITRVLDNNIENPVHNVKDMFYRGKTKYVPVLDLNFPEVFKRHSSIDSSLDVKDIRKEAAALNEEAYGLTKLAIGHEIKSTRIHYSIEAGERRQVAAELNKKAALSLMRKVVESAGPVDLHGFTVKEAILFMDDLYKIRKFERIEVVTGQAYKSSRLRPAIKEWLERHGFTSSDLGPSILGIRRKCTTK